MSGGSFNYLCHAAQWYELGSERDQDIRDMLKALTEYGNEAFPAVVATAQVLAKFAEARKLAAELADVWQAVEWHHSCDWSEDQVLEALTKYNGGESK